MTKEKPILFSTEMVRAILDGRKTMTRRVVKPQIVDRFILDSNGKLLGSYIEGEGDGYPTVDDSPYQVGDILWVRETFAIGKIAYKEEPDGTAVPYISQCEGDSDFIPKEYALREEIGIDDVVWKPSIHMPRAAARIFLRVTNVRVERLQEITPEDIVAEGLPSFIIPPGHEHYNNVCGENWLGFDWYRKLWDSLNAKRGYGWNTNPWVWVYEFERLEEANE